MTKVVDVHAFPRYISLFLQTPVLTCLVCGAAVGDPKCYPPAAVLRGFHARRHFENAIGHTFSGKSGRGSNHKQKEKSRSHKTSGFFFRVVGAEGVEPPTLCL